MHKQLQLIFFAHARSGSSSLLKMLQLHPDLHLIEEPFHEDFASWHPDNPNYRDQIHDRTSLDKQLDTIFATYNGLKVLDYQLSDDLIAHLLQRPNSHVLFLRRRNLLQAVVSAMIGQQTQLWKTWDMTQPLEEYYRHLQPLDISEVKRQMSGLQDHLDYCEKIVDGRSGLPALKLIYEDLYFAREAQRDQQIASIWQWLGITPLGSEQLQYYLTPKTAKVNSAATYAYLPNIQEIEQECGNASTGWLYR